MSVPDDADIARAEALGRAAARAKQTRADCPYPRDGSPADRVLRWRWIRAWAGEPQTNRVVFGSRLAKARRRARALARRTWYGSDDPRGHTDG